MKRLLLTALVLFLTAPLGLAQEQRAITLTDGTRIKGEVTEMTDGTYTIKTRSMGDVRIAEKNIASIASDAFTPDEAAEPSSEPAASANITASPEFQSVQSKILSDPEVMADIQKLIQDPQVMAALADPSFISMVQSGQMDAMAADPRLKKFSENPNVQALIQKIKTK